MKESAFEAALMKAAERNAAKLVRWLREDRLPGFRLWYAVVIRRTQHVLEQARAWGRGCYLYTRIEVRPGRIGENLPGIEGADSRRFPPQVTTWPTEAEAPLRRPIHPVINLRKQIVPPLHAGQPR